MEPSIVEPEGVTGTGAAPAPGISAKTVVALTAETYILRMIALAASFAANVMLARLLGPSGTGLIATANLWSALLGGVLAFGLDSASIYYVGQSAGRFPRLARLLLLYAVPAGLAGTVALLTVDRLAGLLAGPPLLPWITAGLVLTALLTALYNALFIGAGRLSLVNRIATVATIGYLAVVAAVFLRQAADTVVVLAGVLLLQALVVAYLIARALSRPAAGAAEPIRWRGFGAYALKAYAGNLAGLLYFRTTFIILSISAVAAETGIYSIAQVFADIVLIMPLALMNILLPKVAAMSREEAVRRVSQVSRFSIVATLVISLGVALAATLLVPVAFGPAFAPATGMIWILCVGAWLAASGMVLSIYFNGRNKPEITSSGGWLGFAVAAPLTALLVPAWGGYGAAAALTISRLIVAAYMLARYVRDSGATLTSVMFAGPADWRVGWQFVRSLLP